MLRSRLSGLWLLVALSSAGQSAPILAEETSRFGGAEARTCGNCHPRHHREWLSSVHASVARTLPLPPVVDGRRTFEAPECTACHGDELARLPGLGEVPRGHPVRLSHATERTITCVVCHQIVDPLEGRASLARREGPGGEDGRYRERFHRAKPVAELRQADTCGPCHEVSSPSGLPLERTFSQFLASPYPGRGETCVSCHMASFGGEIVPGGHFREQVHRHDIIGSDVFASPVPALGSQRERVRRFLAAAATLYVDAPERVAVGETVPLRVVVVNSGAGHHLPAGFPGERRLWLEVEARLADGRILHRSGFEERPGRDGASSAEPAFSRVPAPGGAVFHDRYLDAGGEEVDFWWEADRVETRSLAALERREILYELPLPADIAGQEIEIDVALRFQACSPSRLERQGLASHVLRYPVLDLHRRVVDAIPVVETLRDPRLVMVPEDETDLQAAIDRAVEGGAVSIAAGLHVIPRSLDFRGKAIRVFGREGAEKTRIEFENVPPETVPPVDASVVVFREGEGPESVLEELTLAGGRGTLVEGRRLGGGVYCEGASPTIRRCEIVENEAGVGGGIFLGRSAARLERNRIERNRASRGGGLASEASPGGVVRNQLVHANRAREDGGGVDARGGLRVEESLIQGNRARRGGGFFSVGQGASGLRLLRVWVQGNAAVLGGGLGLHDDPGRLERIVVAGDAARTGGGLFSEGPRRGEILHPTITENRAVTGGAVHRSGEGELRIRGGILVKNRPLALAGEITYSLLDDPTRAGGTNSTGFPLFSRAPGEWIECEDGAAPGCVPVRWDDSNPPRPARWARFRPGVYKLILGSPAIDAGAPTDPAAADDSRRDQGAIERLRPRRGFVRGDLDGDGRSDSRDIARLLETVFDAPGAVAALPCADAGDVDDDGGLDPVDVYFLIAHHLAWAGPPRPPHPACGLDPTPGEGLGCFEGSAACR